MQNFVYEPLTTQQYQYKIYMNDCDSYIGSQLVQQFRNDHLIEANPNIIIASLSYNKSHYQHSSENYSSNPQHLVPSGVNQIIDINNQRLYNSVLLQADIILFTLNQDNIQQFEYILKCKLLFKKVLKNASLTLQKRIVCISSFLSWGKRKSSNAPNKVAKEFLHLRNSLDYHIKALEDLCLALVHHNQKVKGSVLFSGLVYGYGQNFLFSRFKRALEQQKPLQIYGKGYNHIPTIHLKDLAQIVYNISFKNFQKGKNWHFACDDSKLTQNQLINCIAQNLGNGSVIQKPIEQCFAQDDFDYFTLDIEVKDQEKLQQWHCKQGLKSKIQLIVGEFNEYRGLKPNKILVIGPPVSGKSTVAEILRKNYGLPVITIKSLIEDIKKDQSTFANQIKAQLQQIRIQKIEEQKKIYEEMKKKKKGKGVEDFDPSKVVPRLPDQSLKKVIKWRLNLSDCLNKGYIIDSVIKTYRVAQGVFLADGGVLEQKIFPNTIFAIKALDEQVKQRLKSLPAQKTENTHWTQQHTNRRLQTYHKQNQQKSVKSFFQSKVDIKQVQITYNDQSIFAKFVERNGPLGFKKQMDEAPTDSQTERPQTQQIGGIQDNGEEQLQDEESQQQEHIDEEFNLQKLTERQHKILNEKSRPIRQYLIDNVIPEITEGMLEICKSLPSDPIQFLIQFLEKNNRKKQK